MKTSVSKSIVIVQKFNLVKASMQETPTKTLSLPLNYFHPRFHKNCLSKITKSNYFKTVKNLYPEMSNPLMLVNTLENI